MEQTSGSSSVEKQGVNASSPVLAVRKETDSNPLDTKTPTVPSGLDPVYYALHLLRTRKLDASIAVAANHLNRVGSDLSASASSAVHRQNPSRVLDEQMWYIQTKAMVLNSWYDDVELEGDGFGDDLETDHVVTRSTAAQNPKTSLRAQQLTAGGDRIGSRMATAGNSRGGTALSLAPTGGRPISSRYGFSRPGTIGQQRPGQDMGSRGTAGGPGGKRAGGGTGTAWRPITGRVMRLGTASLQSVPGGPHIHLERLSLEKYARERPIVAKLLCDYLLYVEHRPRMALELCSAALKAEEVAKSARAAAEAEMAVSGADNVSVGEKRSTSPGVPSGVGRRSSPSLQRNNIDEEVGGLAEKDESFPPRDKTAAGSTTAPDKSGKTAPPSVPVLPVYQPQIGIPISQDWWWKARLGKANYQLGLLREAEKWFKASLYDDCGGGGRGGLGGFKHNGGMVNVVRRFSANVNGRVSPKPAGAPFQHYHPSTVMELCKVYLKMDQPLTAMDLYRKAMFENPNDSSIALCMARLQDELHDPEAAFDSFASVLQSDSSNVEAIACIAAFYFYEKNQPELALRYYRRLLQMGVNRAEVWNNIALSAYLTSQFDFALSCFERSLQMCEEDATRADVWFNISHVGTALGDIAFAERALRIAVALDPTHGEALNNLAVLSLEKSARASEKKKQSLSTSADDDESAFASHLLDPHRADAKASLAAVLPVAPFLEEALYNSALMAYEEGELEKSHDFLVRLLGVHPEHPEALALTSRLREEFIFQ